MKKLSIRKYAKTIGVSHWAVGKAIRAGHIKRGYDMQTKKINVRIANKEWGNVAKQRHKTKLIHVAGKVSKKVDPLKIAAANYFTAFESLINELEQRLQTVDFNNKES